MKFRKIVSTAIMAALFFSAPAFIPAKAAFIGCGPTMTGLVPLDTAFAGAPAVPLPCPPGSPGTGPFPWPVLIFGLSVTSVIVNSIYVGQTQCRQLSYQEAWTSVLLPFIGIAFNQLNDQCHPHPHHHHH